MKTLLIFRVGSVSGVARASRNPARPLLSNGFAECTKLQRTRTATPRVHQCCKGVLLARRTCVEVLAGQCCRKVLQTLVVVAEQSYDVIRLVSVVNAIISGEHTGVEKNSEPFGISRAQICWTTNGLPRESDAATPPPAAF